MWPFAGHDHDQDTIALDKVSFTAGQGHSTKRLMLLTTDLDYGGAQRQLLLIARELIAKGWDLKLVTLLQPKALVEEVLELELQFESLGITSSFGAARPIAQLVRLINEWRPDVMHCHMVHANLVGRAVRPFTNVPVMISAARNVNEGRRWREVAYRLTDWWSDATVQNSEAGAKRYVDIRAVPSRKIRFIPNGVNTKYFVADMRRRDRTRKRLGVDKNFLWLAVGRVEPQKDYPTLVRAFGEEQRKGDRATRLLIIGAGEADAELRASIAGQQLESAIDVLEPTSDVVSYMNAADGFVMSSSWEGMPNVLLEAASCGLPIVATDVGGVSEVVRHGETGFLVASGAPVALGEAMTRVRFMPSSQRAAMGRCARAFIEQYHEIGEISDRWIDLYLSLLAEKRHE